jgi:NAD(P)-dependent dehydrogenase (short-subunit alcohol dehydrogenase family)
VAAAESGVALALAVSLKLHPLATLGAAAAGMLSLDGRCKTFDTAANGYVRTEGVCSLLLTATQSALVVNSSAVRQDGRSASLTAPNGSAQLTLLQLTLLIAGLSTADVHSVEAHGTGTALGDPTEAGALAAVHGKQRDLRGVVLGTGKASVGHAEAVSSLLGVWKAVKGMRHVEGTGNAKLRVMNPMVSTRLAGNASVILLATSTLACVHPAAASGVSSFGYSGTISHAVLHALFCLPLRCSHARCSLNRRCFAWKETPAFTPSSAAATAFYSTHWVAAPTLSAAVPAVWLLLRLHAASSMQQGLHDAGGHAKELSALATISPLAALSTRGVSWQLVALQLGAAEDAAPSIAGVETALLVAQQLECSAPAARLLLITCGAVTASSTANASPMASAAHGGVWGLGRIIRLEMAATLSVDFPSHRVGREELLDLVLHDGAQLAWYAGRRSAACLRSGMCPLDHVPAGSVTGTILVTGALGGLGLSAIKLLVSRGALRVLGASRSGRVARDGQGLAAELHRLCTAGRAQIDLLACNIGEQQHAAAACGLKSVRTPVSGLLHAASGFGSSRVVSTVPAYLPRMYGAKAAGATHLHHLLSADSLDMALFYSSLSAVGSAYTYTGTAIYSAANAHLDSLCQLMRVHGSRAHAIQMANVGEVGSGALLPDQFAKQPGIVRITQAQYLASIGASIFDRALGALACVSAVLPVNDKVRAEFEGPALRVLEPIQTGNGAFSTLTLKSRLSSFRAAREALDGVDGMMAQARDIPATTEAAIVGFGFAGMTAASAFAQSGVALVVIEKGSSMGGVWRWQGNPYSRVNSSEPGYRLIMRRRAINTNHSFSHEMLDEVRACVAQHSLTERVFSRSEVSTVHRSADDSSFCVHGRQADHNTFALHSSIVVLCTNRRLGVPKSLHSPAEAGFSGTTCRGLGGDNLHMPWTNARVLLIGIGAFSVEQVRTAYEHGAAHVTILCRRHGLISPQIVDYLNVVRPYAEDFKHPVSGSGFVVGLWQRVYAKAGATPPECWGEGIYRPDGHTVSVSDLYFIAHHRRLLSTRRGTVRAYSADGVFTSSGAHMKAQALVNCYGFEVNEQNERLVGRSHMTSGMWVDCGLRCMFEGHLDSKANMAPFPSYVSGLNFSALTLLSAWQSLQLGGGPGSVLLPRVRISHITATQTESGLASALEGSSEAGTMLRQYLAEMQAEAYAAWRPEEYVTNNQLAWEF